LEFLYKMEKVSLDKLSTAFSDHDRNATGALDLWDLRSVLSAVNMSLTEDQLLQLIDTVDNKHNGSLDLPGFIRLLRSFNSQTSNPQEEKATVAAFVAMGGKSNRSGEVSTSRLVKVIQDFRLNINIEDLLKEIDTDQSGCIDYEEFKALLGEN